MSNGLYQPAVLLWWLRARAAESRRRMHVCCMTAAGLRRAACTAMLGAALSREHRRTGSRRHRRAHAGAHIAAVYLWQVRILRLAWLRPAAAWAGIPALDGSAPAYVLAPQVRSLPRRPSALCTHSDLNYIKIIKTEV